MPSIADLNVRIGVIYKDLDDGLKGVERSLRQSGRRLSQLGSDLTLSISAPLALLGGASIKAAGDLQAMELALESQLGSAEAARKELALLREEALKPGLGFEQAVKGSVSLQAVGFEAENARKILGEFGNALALAGKGKAELDGVVLALTQIAAKGVVSAEEINQIAERLPQIRTLMKQAFGTASSEEIQKLGIGAEKFIEGITAQMESLPRAAGGIKNSLENAGDAVNQFLGTIGKEINRVFDLEGKAQALSVALSDLSGWFISLDDSTKAWIVGLGAAAIAAGPLIKVYGVMKTLGAEVIAGFRGMLEVLKNLSGAALNAAKWFGTLNTAMKLTVIGAAIAAATALYLVYDKLANSLSDAERAQIAVNDVSRQAENTITAERVRAEQLVGVLKSDVSTRKEKEAALKALQSISPKYFGNLDTEKSKIKDIDAALDGYVSSLRRAAKAQAAFDQIVELEKQLNDIGKAAEPTFFQQATNAVLGFGNAAAQAALNAKDQAKNTTELKAQIEAQIKALEGVVNANQEVAESTKGATSGNTNFTKSSIGAKDAAKEYAKALASIAAVSQKGDVLGADVISEQAKEIESQIERLLEAGFKPYSKQIMNLRDMLKGLREDAAKGFSLPNLTQQKVGFSLDVPELSSLDIPSQVVSIDTTSAQDSINALSDAATKGVESASAYKTQWEQIAEIMVLLQDGSASFSEIIGQSIDTLNQRGQGLQATFLTMADAMGNAFATAEGGFREMALAAVAAGAKIIKVTIQEGVARAVASALKGAPFPLNLALGAVAGGLASGLFSKAISSIGVPALAGGGVLDKPTLALVGEYAGARSNPEIVTPERKMRAVFEAVIKDFGRMQAANQPAFSQIISPQISVPNGMFSGGDGPTELYSVIRGDDLLLVTEKASARRRRFN